MISFYSEVYYTVAFIHLSKDIQRTYLVSFINENDKVQKLKL